MTDRERDVLVMALHNFLAIVPIGPLAEAARELLRAIDEDRIEVRK